MNMARVWTSTYPPSTSDSNMLLEAQPHPVNHRFGAALPRLTRCARPRTWRLLPLCSVTQQRRLLGCTCNETGATHVSTHAAEATKQRVRAPVVQLGHDCSHEQVSLFRQRHVRSGLVHTTNHRPAFPFELARPVPEWRRIFIVQVPVRVGAVAHELAGVLEVRYISARQHSHTCLRHPDACWAGGGVERTREPQSTYSMRATTYLR